MKQSFYNYNTDNDSLTFIFESVSEKKIVRKTIIYTPFDDNQDIYNLTLADILPDGTFSDKTVSNNEDMNKIMATVIQTIIHFFVKYSSKMIYIEGSTPERTRLYRIILAKELSEIEKTFNIYGVINDDLERFVKNRPYQSFIITLKNQENLLKLRYENNTNQ
jgi:hypothetical protein